MALVGVSGYPEFPFRQCADEFADVRLPIATLRSNDYLAAANNIKQEQLGGAGSMMDGIYYNFVDDAELARVQSLMQKELELK